MGLSFNTLREANALRVGKFKNLREQPAHKSNNGSDWSVAQWFQAFIGEVGEFAEVRDAFERGIIDFDTYKVKATKELADIQTYLDLLAMRSLDITARAPGYRYDAAQLLLLAMGAIGDYANMRKKFDRGDATNEELTEHRLGALSAAIRTLGVIRMPTASNALTYHQTEKAHPCGINLGQATADKFNEVSERVKVDIRINVELDLTEGDDA